LHGPQLGERQSGTIRQVKWAFSVDPQQQLSEPDELDVVRRAVALGYESAWTPSGPDEMAFERCLRWYEASGIATGISVVPAAGQPPAFYAEHGRRVWEATGGRFRLGVGSGRLPHAAAAMRTYLAELRALLPPEQPVYLAALGPRMLALAGEVADGVGLNWCTPEHVRWSRNQVEEAAATAHRPVREVVEYIRTAVDPDSDLALRTLARFTLQYALGSPPYRRHFERMGFGEDLRRVESEPAEEAPDFVKRTGAAGVPGDVRPQVERLAEGLDTAIVRVLVTRPGEAASAIRVLEECAPQA
jgi:alkanesulfonate monooxygenase SsuD/methylene tetrahydromethanopterin reductase-like flavin-dependent oxidoreductase (luciferase family)